MKRPEPAAGATFAEPWQAQVFALAVKLSEAGLFTWPEWTDTLSREVAGLEAPGYEQWLAALEKLLAAKGVMTEQERQARIDAWDREARATPHGKPILLSRA